MIQINKFTKQLIQQARFYCKNEDCHLACPKENSTNSFEKIIGLSYKEALEHSQICQYSTVMCPYGCGQEIQDNQNHVEICEMKKVSCKICNLEYYRGLTHDCLEALKNQVKINK